MLASGTVPTASAQAWGPPSSPTSSDAAAEERVSFHSNAFRTTLWSSVSATIPCCCPATAMARTSASSPAEVASSYAAHQAAGSTSVPSGCAARPSRTISPVAASQTTTLVDWVDESTPATRTGSVMNRVCPARQPFQRRPCSDLVQRVQPSCVGLGEPLVGRQVTEQLLVLHERQRFVSLSRRSRHDPVLA